MATTTRTVLVLEHASRPVEYRLTDKRQTLAQLEHLLNGLVTGAFRLTSDDSVTVYDVDGTAASGTVTLTNINGEVTATINGVDCSAPDATTDEGEAGSMLAEAINLSEDPLVQGVVTATDNGAGVVTITAVTPGVGGNYITLAANGTGAAASGARLTGGVDQSGRTLDY